MSQITIERSGNRLVCRNLGHLTYLVCEALTYTYRKLYRGPELRQRQAQLEHMKVVGDPAADRFRPAMGFYQMPVYLLQADGSLACPAGMLKAVATVIKEAGQDVAYYDMRTRCLPPADFDRLLKYPELCNFRFRQTEVLAAIDGNPNGIVLAPTGFGKSTIAKMCCVIWPNSRVLFTTPGRDTLKSVYESLKAMLPGQVGQVGAGKCKTDCRVTVASVDSLHKVDLQTQDLIIGDECHEYATPTAMRNFSRFTEAKLIGLTASWPARGDGADMVVEAIFGPPIIDISYQDAEQGGSVVPIKVLMLDIGSLQGYNNTSDGDAWYRQAYWRNKQRNEIFAHFMKNGISRYVGVPDPQMLCMVDKIDHAFELRQFLPDYRLVYAAPQDNVEWQKRVKSFRNRRLWSDLDPPMTSAHRDELRRQFEAGELRRAISTGVWKQGVSFNELAVLARLDGGAGEIDNTQLPGRLSRIHTTKSAGILVDSTDQYDERAASRADRRMRSYRSRGWDVQKVSWNESTLFPV